MSHQAPLAAAWPTSASRLENGRSLCGTWAFFCVSAGWGQHRGCAPSEFDLREGSQEKERAGGGALPGARAARRDDTWQLFLFRY